MAQRIVRAKRTLADSRVPFEVPRGAELADRLASVLEVIYLVFNEGYAATAGEDWVRPQLCEEALRLGRILAELAPTEPEVHGLVALMEIQASRLKARVGPAGEPVLLLDQDRARWDQLLIRRGLAALARAEATAAAAGRRPAPTSLQAAIAACHARARDGGSRPTGRASPRSTRRWRSCSPRRWWSSIARWRWAWRTARRRGWSWWTALAGGAVARRLPPAARRARRSARQARPPRRGARRVRARGVPHPQRPRARPAARACGDCRRARPRVIRSPVRLRCASRCLRN